MTTTDVKVSTRLWVATLKARATAVTNAEVYVGEAIDVSTDPVSGRVRPYLVIHASPGNPDVEPDLADTALERDWLFQITAVGGTTDDAYGIADRVHQTFYRWTPVMDGLVFGPCHPPPGYRPLLLPDRDFTPHRYFVPLQFQTTATTPASTTQE